MGLGAGVCWVVGLGFEGTLMAFADLGSSIR